MADDKILKQLDNDAFVIGYQPDLEYKKDRTAVGKAISSNNGDTNYDPENDTKLYSKTLNGFSKNMPSNVLKDINYVLKNIARLKNKLAKRFNEDRALMNNPFYDSSSTIDPDIIISLSFIYRREVTLALCPSNTLKGGLLFHSLIFLSSEQDAILLLGRVINLFKMPS